MRLGLFKSMLIFGALLPACSSDTPRSESSRPELEVEVVFAGLLERPEVASQERLHRLGQELAKSPSDLICLQGVWSADDRGALIAEVAGVLPYSVALPTDDDSPIWSGAAPPLEAEPTTPSCVGSDAIALEALLGCLTQQCSTELGSDAGRQRAFRCTDPEGGECRSAYDQLDAGADAKARCRTCFDRYRGQGVTFSETRKRCRDTPGNTLMYRGAHGLLLLSKLPLTAPELTVLPSTGQRRAILSAQVAVDGRSIAVHCAALGAEGAVHLGGEPNPLDVYPGVYGDITTGWIREHGVQVDALLARLESSSPFVLMGDLGTSEEIVRNGEVVLEGAAPDLEKQIETVCEPAIPASYELACTTCPENPLAWLEPEKEVHPSWLNRVWLDRAANLRAASGVRTLLGNVVPPVNDPFQFQTSWLPLVPQYGYRLTIEL